MSEQDKQVLVGAHVSLEQQERLKARAEREDRSVASLIRIAIEAELERQEPKVIGGSRIGR